MRSNEAQMLPWNLPLPVSLVDDVLVVVISQPAGKLLVVHLGLVLSHPPSTSNLEKTEFPIIHGTFLTSPCDKSIPDPIICESRTKAVNAGQ